MFFCADKELHGIYRIVYSSLCCLSNLVMKGIKMTQATTSTATAQQLQTALILKQETALIRRSEVEKLTALSRSRIYALMATGNFPKPVQLGAMSVAWLEIEVRGWIAARIADRSTAAGV